MTDEFKTKYLVLKQIVGRMIYQSVLSFLNRNTRTVSTLREIDHAKRAGAELITNGVAGSFMFNLRTLLD